MDIEGGVPSLPNIMVSHGENTSLDESVMVQEIQEALWSLAKVKAPR